MPAPRLHVDRSLTGGQTIELPAGASHHVRVLRLGCGANIVLFDGQGGEWLANIEDIGHNAVRVLVGAHQPVDRELRWRVTSAFAMPANDRMDALVEKLVELGVDAIQPLVCERSVLRIAGERAARKLVHWRGIVVAACEQSGRTRLPRVEPVRRFDEWIGGSCSDAGRHRWLLSLQQASPLREVASAIRPGELVALSGPEGGLSSNEEFLASERGFLPVSLGPRVLRADTAPLALLAALEHLAAPSSKD